MNICYLELKNFCGISCGKLDFHQLSNTIRGNFGSGKSTFLKAFKWVIGIGNDFEPNIGGKKVYGIETQVEMCIESEGAKNVFKRTAKQQWKILDGEQRFDKYLYRYFINDLEVKSKDYSGRILLYFDVKDDVELSIFADPQYFNSVNDAKWNPEKRRTYLFKLFNIDEKARDLASSYPDFYELMFAKGMQQSDIKKTLKQKKGDIEAKQKQTFAWVEQLSKKVAEMNGIDFESIAEKISDTWEKIGRLQNECAEESVMNAIERKYAEISKIKADMAEQAKKNEDDIAKWNTDLRKLKLLADQLLLNIDSCDKATKKLNSEYEDIQIERDLIESEGFKCDTVCPLCGSEISPEKIESSKVAFEYKKKEALAKNESRARENRLQLSEVAKRDEEYTQKEEALEREIEALESVRPKEADFSEHKKKIALLEDEIQTLKKESRKDVNKEEISSLQATIESLNLELHQKDILQECQRSLDECKKKSEELAVEYSEVVNDCSRFDELSESISRMASDALSGSFGGIEFNLFKEQGGSADKAFKNICTATMNGISYENLSGGQQIICDYMVGRALRAKTGKSIPMWIDEICRVASNEDLAKNVLEIDRNCFQTIVLITADGAKLPVSYISETTNT